MSLNEDPAANRMRTPAAPTFHPLAQVSKDRVRICHLCGLVLAQDFPWIICDDCQLLRARGIPSPGHTLLANQDATALGQAGQSFLTCVVCQMTVEGPRITSTSYTLCPTCRVRQLEEGVKLKPTRRTNPHIPSLLPPTSPVIPTPRDPSRPRFFNSRGEIIAPSPVPVIVTPMAPMRVCMRFGCGAQLVPNQLLNFCDACLRLGFGRGASAPPPSAPKCTPKRMGRDEVPTGVLISKVKRDIDATQRAEAPLQPSQETFAELGAHSNDDLDLELMYPEDEELAAQDSVDSTTKTVSDNIPPPDAALERGPLQLSPLVLSNTARSPSPQPVQRTCETPGCGGAVPLSATWQRCYGCSLQRWKERQQAAIAASATSEPVLPVDGTVEAIAVDRVTTSREPEVSASHSQGAILNAVDKLQLSKLPDGQIVIDSAAVASTSSTLLAECSRDAGAEPKINEVYISGWNSDLTDLSSEDEDVDSDPDAEDSSTIKIRIPVLASRLPSGTSARVCGVKRCNIVLPPDYRWKICDFCRRYQREYQRIRMEKARRRIEDFSRIDTHESALGRDHPASFSEEQPDEMTPGEGSRVCAVPRCYTWLLPVTKHRWKCCGVCRMCTRDDARARQSNAGAILDLEEPNSSLDIPPFPTFQNRGVLLSEFDAMLGRFLEAQILYLRVKLQTAGEKASLKLDPVLFAFDGEYSTVTGQRGYQNNVQGKSGPEHGQEEEMQKEAASAVRELGSTLLTEFKSTKGFIIKSGGVIMRYKCALELIIPFHPLPKTTDSKDINTSSSHVPYMKPVCGELEVAVVPDDSHNILVGRRTIIRFRMLG